jgi:hypothetical protein
VTGGCAGVTAAVTNHRLWREELRSPLVSVGRYVDRKPMSQPTRRYHLPSALRPSSLRITAAAAQSLVAEGARLIDCRRKDDLAHPLAGATRIPPDEIPAFASTLAPGVEVVLACT